MSIESEISCRRLMHDFFLIELSGRPKYEKEEGECESETESGKENECTKEGKTVPL